MELRKYGVGTGADLIIPIVKAGVSDFAVAADWTPAAGDVKISKDGGTAANIGTLPVFVTGIGWKFVFTDAELTAKRININVVDSATKAIEDQHIIIETYGNASAQHPDIGSAVGAGATSGAIGENYLYKSGSDLVIPYTALDSLSSGITGLTVKFSLKKLATGLYWDNASGAFDSVAEVLNTATAKGNGLYEYTCTGGFSAEMYMLRVEATQTTTGDIANYTVTAGAAGDITPTATAAALAQHDTDVKAIANAIKAKTDNLPHSVRKNTAIANFPFAMYNTAGVLTAGLTVTASRKLDADAAWTVMTGGKVDRGDGAYSIDINAADTNGNAGTWKFEAAGAKTTLIQFLTEAV